MGTYHFVDLQGNYIGGFGDGAIPLEGAIQVFKAPAHGKDIWDFVKEEWKPYTPPMSPSHTLQQIMDSLTVGEQLQFGAVIAVVRYHLDKPVPDLEAVAEAIQLTPVPEELTARKQAMLNALRKQ